MKSTGTVYLVGAGPRDAGLLTLRGAELLARADVVVYDALINGDILALAPPSAEIIYAGKRSGEHAIPQEELNRLLADKARAGKLTPDEMSGGTFTISNMGMLNVENFSAIINPGEGAILAVASTLPQPAVRDAQLVIRQIMKMTLSVDHRLIDGALGAQFINAVKAKLEDLELWKRLSA